MMHLRLLLLLAVVAPLSIQDVRAQGRWTPERAAAWQKEKGWLVGSNFIPSTAIYPWSSWTKPFTAEPPIWHHDLFRKDGTAFDDRELKIIRSLTGKNQ
jgi:hypothetical protein